MIGLLLPRRIIFAYLFLSCSFYSCTRPGDHPLNKQDDNIPAVIVPVNHGPLVHTVEIIEMKFQPDNITVRAGDTIVWINKDITTHCVTGAGTKAWTSLNIPKDSSWKMVVKGNSNYYCAIHRVMKGKITVE